MAIIVPDNLITIESTKNDLMHYGTKRHSGRYPWSSGERPFQGMSERARKKNIEVGTKRLTNRINRANAIAQTDKYSKK